MMKKRLFVLAIALILLFGSTVDVLAFEPFGSGSKEDPWKLNSAGTVTAYVENKILYVDGSGEMENGKRKTKPLVEEDHFNGVEISEGVTSIGDFAFPMKWFTYVAIPASVTKIGQMAFWHCYNLKNIYYGGTEEQWNAIDIGSDNEALTGAEILFNGERESEEDRKPEVIRIAGSEDLLTVGTVLKSGTKIDFSDCKFDGTIKYSVPAAFGITPSETYEGKELTVESHPELDPGVTEWEVKRVSPPVGVIELVPRSYARGFSGDSNGCYFVNAEIGFPGVNRAGTIKYYSDKNAAEPFYTETVSGGKGSVTAPEGSPAGIKAWKLKACDIPSNTIELYPYDKNGYTYDLVKYVPLWPEVDIERLSDGMVIERGVKLTSEGEKFWITYKGFGDVWDSGYLNTLTIAPEGVFADVQYWLIDYKVSWSIVLIPLLDMAPKFNELSFEPAEGEKIRPWQIGKDGGNIKAYIEDGELYIEGEGMMQNFGDMLPVPWLERRGEIRHVNLSGEIKSIGSYAFDQFNNEDFKTISLPNTIETIGEGAFRGCTNLQLVVFPDSVKRIGVSAFCDCTNLRVIILPGSLERIDNGAFRFCKSLVYVDFPDSLKRLGERAFYGCLQLMKAKFGSGIEYIGDDAFYGVHNLFGCSYRGSESEWKKVEIGEWNENISNPYFEGTATIIGEGNVVIVIGIAAAAVAVVVALVIIRKKKTAAGAEERQ